jgi:archaellum component FlaF (FlaF/FlaG flagellin family)
MDKKAFSAVAAYIILFIIIIVACFAIFTNYFRSVDSTFQSFRISIGNRNIENGANLTILNVSYSINLNPDITNVTVKNTGRRKIKLSDISVFLNTWIPNSTANMTREVLSPDIVNPGILDPGESAAVAIKMDLSLNKTNVLTVSAFGAKDMVYYENRRDSFWAYRATDNGTDGTTVDTAQINRSDNSRAVMTLNVNSNRYLRANYSLNVSSRLFDNNTPIENLSNSFTNIYQTTVAVEHYESSANINVRELQYWTGAAWGVIGSIPWRGTGTRNEGTDIMNSSGFINQANKNIAMNPVRLRIRYRTSAGTPTARVDLLRFKPLYTVFWRPSQPHNFVK